MSPHWVIALVESLRNNAFFEKTWFWAGSSEGESGNGREDALGKRKGLVKDSGAFEGGIS